MLGKEEIQELVTKHKEAPHQRELQKVLGKEVTIMVHSEEDFENALAASEVLFGKSTADDFRKLNEATFLDIFEGVPQAEVAMSDIEAGLDMIAALAAKTSFLNSNGEARRALKENSVSVNKEKVGEDYTITSSDLINNKYVILNKGKKNTYIIRAV